MTKENPLDKNEVNLQENEELVDILTELDNKPEESKAAEETQETAETKQEEEVVAETTEENTEEPKLEGKYAGKSIEEVVQMHQEAEKLVGRQGAEVGELRKIVDEFIKNKVSETKENLSNTDNVEPDFFDNPKEAVAKAVAGSEEMKQIKELLAKQNEQEVLGKLTTKHPDYVDIVKDPAFGDWVRSSKVRVELLERADKYDFDAADELLSFWKERKGIVEKTKAINDEDRKQQRKAASTGGKGSGEPVSRKIYKRSDIVNLMTNNPEKYRANINEIQKAYEEGRVR
tara:strand:+ start:931 stop:1794 length:864 start_codon:yes stop_codon:yes gene_type:complete